jgi:hypothetical protein
MFAEEDRAVIAAILRNKTVKDELVSIPLGMTVSSLSSEEWREYEFGPPDARFTYRINHPVKLYVRNGGSTHRVSDQDGVVHCLPAPGKERCVLRWKNKAGMPECTF